MIIRELVYPIEQVGFGAVFDINNHLDIVFDGKEWISTRHSCRMVFDKGAMTHLVFDSHEGFSTYAHRTTDTNQLSGAPCPQGHEACRLGCARSCAFCRGAGPVSELRVRGLVRWHKWKRPDLRRKVLRRKGNSGGGVESELGTKMRGKALPGGRLGAKVRFFRSRGRAFLQCLRK